MDFMAARSVVVSNDEIRGFRDLQVRRRWQRPASFSANRRSEIWPFGLSGLTLEERWYGIRGQSQLLDRVADEFLCWSPRGGRFWIDDKCAFHRNRKGRRITFACFVVKLKP